LQIIDIIAQHPDHEIIIGIDTLGKEDLLLQIAEALNIKVFAYVLLVWEFISLYAIQ